MHQIHSYYQQPAQKLSSEFPAVISYKEYLDARQNRLDEKSKSAGNLGLLKGLDNTNTPLKLPPVNYKQPALLKKLNYDFGSLKELLSYDLKLKKPEDLFKMSEHERRLEVKNKEDDLKKGLMQHMKHDVDNRDAKTILIEEKDPEKVSKAAKKFVSDMMTEIFKDDMHLFDKKAHKGANKQSDILTDIDEDNPIKKITEKYGYKSLAEKFTILDSELDKKKYPDNQPLSHIRKPRPGLVHKGGLQQYGAGQAESNSQSPIEIGPFKQGRRGSKISPANPSSNSNQTPYMYISEDVAVRDFSGDHARVDRSSPVPKRHEISESDRLAYAMRILTDSDVLGKLYKEYESGDKEQYNKEMKAVEETSSTGFRDVYELRDDEAKAAISPNFIVFAHNEKKPHFFLHLSLNYNYFASLWVLNIRGCRLPESIVWFMLTMVQRHSKEIRVLDVSENQISLRVCNVIKELLTTHNLKRLKMANSELTSKGLATVCLGLAKNTSVIEVDFNYNEIDEYGFKALALILRHTKTLQQVKILRKKKRILLPTGEEREAEDELGYTAMTAFTKAFKHNKSIDPKNIQLFEAE